MNAATGALITSSLLSLLELYLRMRAENPNLFKDDDAKTLALIERVQKELQKPADYAQTWRP